MSATTTTTTVPLERKVLSENDRLAAELRAEFTRHGIFCLNLIGSPGAGKTALLERTLQSFAPDKRVAVLTGDIQTDADARRLARYGFPVRQITTAGACHLDARMVVRAPGRLGPGESRPGYSSRMSATLFVPPVTTWVRRRKWCCSASPRAKRSP